MFVTIFSFLKEDGFPEKMMPQHLKHISRPEVGFQSHPPIERTRDKCLILGLKQAIYKMRLEYLVVLGSKKGLKTQINKVS